MPEQWTKDKPTYEVKYWWSEEDDCWYGQCTNHDGLKFTTAFGDTLEECMKEFAVAMSLSLEALADMEAH